MVADDPSVELEVDVETVPAGVPADAASVPVILVVFVLVFGAAKLYPPPVTVKPPPP